jgi:hypothetical protein
MKNKPMTEIQTVAALHQLAKRWPKQLTLFANSGALQVVRDLSQDGGVAIAQIKIPSNGGDMQLEEGEPDLCK